MARPDSIVEARQGGYVYITTDTTSLLYKWAVPDPDFDFSSNVLTDYINHIKVDFKQNPIINDLGNIPRKWNPVYLYRGRYFLYGPSDWMVCSGFIITDSIIYTVKSDPDDLFFILGYSGNQSDLINLNVLNYSGIHETIKIHLIDENYGIYSWTFSNMRNEIVSVRLMQDSRYSKKLPMIVCDCGDSKCLLEFEFEKPDFTK